MGVNWSGGVSVFEDATSKSTTLETRGLLEREN